jgi:hypothetical protein
VGEEHARIVPALGAYAADALEPQEAAEVEAHLATCAACRAEAERLGRAAAWLGSTQETPPPERLRDAVLAAVRGERAVPGEADEALAAAAADLDGVLGGLSGEQWRRPVVHGWDVGELLRHLAVPAGPGPEATLRKAFETWIHADDLRSAFGRPASPPAPDHVHAVVALGARLLPPAMRALGVGDPGRAVALRLRGPGGGTWTVPPAGAGPVAATVTAPAVEFFYLMGNRRDPATVATSVAGDRALAADLLRAAATLGCD